MALVPPSYRLQQSSGAINQLSLAKSKICQAFLLRTVHHQLRTSSNCLQIQRAQWGVRHQELRARQRRVWTRSSVAVEGKEEDTVEQQKVDLISSSTAESLHEPRKPAEAEPIPLRQQPLRTGGGLQWILGPLALLVTGALPALWLPSPALFNGAATAGLLALNGLDATFNMGATAFLLMAHSSARRKDPSLFKPNIPLGYKVWSFLVNLVGLAAPIALVVASSRGVLKLQPTVHRLPGAALLGPYMLLLLVQWLAEALVWQWQSPVWPVLPLVYQAYRVVQLTRGLELGAALDAPAWLVEAVKGLAAWWVFVLGMQIMWLTWLVGNIQVQAGNE